MATVPRVYVEFEPLTSYMKAVIPTTGPSLDLVKYYPIVIFIRYFISGRI